MVASSAASTPGERKGVLVMLMPIRSVVVFAASQGSAASPGTTRPARSPAVRSGTRSSCRTGTGAPGDRTPPGRRSGRASRRSRSRAPRRGREVLELLDGHLVAEVRQVESELHERRPPRRALGGSQQPRLRSGRTLPDPHTVDAAARARALTKRPASAVRVNTVASGSRALLCSMLDVDAPHRTFADVWQRAVDQHGEPHLPHVPQRARPDRHMDLSRVRPHRRRHCGAARHERRRCRRRCPPVPAQLPGVHRGLARHRQARRLDGAGRPGVE